LYKAIECFNAYIANELETSLKEALLNFNCYLNVGGCAKFDDTTSFSELRSTLKEHLQPVLTRKLFDTSSFEDKVLKVLRDLMEQDQEVEVEAKFPDSNLSSE
jgi:hypothetical protein